MIKKIIVRTAAFFFALGIIGLISVFAIWAYVSKDLPQIASLADYNPALPSRIVSREGATLLETGRERRVLVEFEDIPSTIVDAFIAAEDDRFFEHRGIDYQGIFRAFIANIKAGRIVQGGSTITQQVAISLLLSRERLLIRKLQDFLLALRIEKKFSKEQILYLYLNQVYLGGGHYGIVTAFRGYFGKELDEVTVSEAALVAGLLVAPGRFSPYINPRAALRRQGYVLRRMLDTGKINQEDFQAAVEEPIRLRTRRRIDMEAGHFTDWVRRRVIKKLGEEEFLTGGYLVETTLNWDLQQRAEREVLNGLKEIDKRQGFSGPLEKIESTPEAITAWELETRIEMLKNASDFFVLNEELERIFEYEVDINWWEQRNRAREEWQKELRDSRFIAGNISDDPLLEQLEVGEMYQGLVLKADNAKQIIYVSVGGVVGIIPQSLFRWARARSITSEREYWQWVTRPSEVVRSGDIVWVRPVRQSVGVFPSIEENFRNRLNESLGEEKLSLIRSERYVLFALDQVPEVEGALLSLSPQTGEIISFVGGMDFRRSQFSRANQSQRQTGSAFKPLIFAAALEEGYTPSTIVFDTPEALAGVEEGLNWKPRNYDNQFKGPITFRNALEQSRNVPTIKIAEDIGVRKIHEFSKRLGFQAQLPPDLTLALGTFGSTLLDLVTTFAVFPSGGKLVEAKSIFRVIDRHGNILDWNENVAQEDSDEIADYQGEGAISPSAIEEFLKEVSEIEEDDQPKNPFLENLTETQVYDQRLAYLMTNMLRGVVLHGTGQGARSLSTYLGGKTGTTNNFVDAWFVGFSPHLATGVWTGFDDNRPMGHAETGARAALPIWTGYMREAQRVYGESDFPVPRGIVNIMINKETGELARGNQTNLFREAFLAGHGPGERPVRQRSSSEEEGPEELFEDEDFFQ